MKCTVSFWLWKMRRRVLVATVLRHQIDKSLPKPSPSEWRELYDWTRDINRRVADGSIRDIPPVEVQLADHFERLGIVLTDLNDAESS